MCSDGGASARATYELLAPIYDRFSANFDHETWLSRLLAVAEEAGATGRRVLDVACGTGKSFVPLLARGYDVSACDISPAMVELARERAGGRADVFVADMRDLPPRGPFDLVFCLDDAVNYLLSRDELRRAFSSARSQLAQDGLYIFDTNTLLTYRTAFAQDAEFSQAGWHFRWRGEGSPDAEPGATATATVRAVSGTREVTAQHVQRHHPIETVRAELAAAGLELVTELGQTTGSVLHSVANDLRHNKTVFMARRGNQRTQPEAEDMTIIP